MAVVYAPSAINPACPSEKSPVKPVTIFMDNATTAYTSDFSIIDIA